MCGFCGVVNATDVEHVVRSMTATMLRRGPDDEGYWSAEDGRTHLGFRRLAILDLTEAGHQPMLSADGRGVVAYNGELYNFVEIRRMLEGQGVVFRSTGDTEVLVELLRREGIAGLQRLNGMFGLAYVDLDAGTTLLARDHVGIKPLYYMVEPGGPGVAFASRYDALFHTGWVHVDDMLPEMLDTYLQFGHVPAPLALHPHCGQVPAGGWVLLDRSGIRRAGRWWTPPHERTADITTAGEAVEATTAALVAAVRRQRMADVPVGSFLSAGIDSPILAGISRTMAPDGLDAYTVSCHDAYRDEGPPAAKMAAALDLRHHLVEVGAADVDLEASAGSMHEPLGDDSLVPALLVSQRARADITVALSGDGGDELFFGYRRQLSTLQGFRWSGLPHSVRSRYSSLRTRLRSAPMDWGAGLLHPDPGSYYRTMLGNGSGPLSSRLVADAAPVPEIERLFAFEGRPNVRRLGAFAREIELDFRLIPILKKIDMASMHHSLEVRVPFLDREVIDVAARITPRIHLAGWQQKSVLRQVLADLVAPLPVSTVKTGFVLPLAEWFRGHHRDVIGPALLDASPLPIDPDVVAALWREHQSGVADHTSVLWRLAALRWWRDRVAVEARSPRVRS